ncbi:MAG: hypothetical protein ACYC3V_13610, partial [Chloroflexota bacterium]
MSGHAHSPAISREEGIGGLLSMSGALLLALSPSAAMSALALSLLVAGVALRPAFGLALLGLTL